MSKIKAVVLEKSGSRLTVLSKNGTFSQVRLRSDAAVGEEIEIQDGLVDFRGLRVWAGVAAIFLLVMTTILGWNLYQAPTAVALVSVNVNPSLEFTVDAQGNLLKLDTQNEDAKQMLSQLDLKGKPIDQALDQIITQAIKQNYLSSEQDWIVVGYSPLTDKTSDKMPKQLNEKQILEWVTQSVESKGFTPQVAVFSMTPQEKELAQKGDLTLGEYALWQTAQKAGVESQLKKLKDPSEQKRLLKDPQVQVQIMKEKKGIESFSPQKSSTSQQDLGTKALKHPVTEKMMPMENLFTPGMNLNPWIEKNMEQAENKSKLGDQRSDQPGVIQKEQPKGQAKGQPKDQANALQRSGQKAQLQDQKKEIQKAPPEVSDSSRNNGGSVDQEKAPTKEHVDSSPWDNKSIPIPWNSGQTHQATKTSGGNADGHSKH